MTACEDIQGLLAERASGPVAPEDEARLDAHLPVCERCRRELAAYESTFALLRETPPAASSSSIAPAALAAWKVRHRRRVTAYVLGAGFVAAAAAATVALAPALLGRAGRGASEPSPAASAATTTSPSQEWDPDVDGALQASALLESDASEEDGTSSDEIALAAVDAAEP